MRYRRLGSSDLDISVVSLGSWKTYGGSISDEQARACIDTAFAVGINFIDTANVYRAARPKVISRGGAGRARPRDSYVLGDEVFGFRCRASGTGEGLSAAADAQADATLSLQPAAARTTSICTSAIGTTRSTPLEETMEALTEVVRQWARPATSVSVSARPR